jgi:hypothetical protein
MDKLFQRSSFNEKELIEVDKVLKRYYESNKNVHPMKND